MLRWEISFLRVRYYFFKSWLKKTLWNRRMVPFIIHSINISQYLIYKMVLDAFWKMESSIRTFYFFRNFIRMILKNVSYLFQTSLDLPITTWQSAKIMPEYFISLSLLQVKNPVSLSCIHICLIIAPFETCIWMSVYTHMFTLFWWDLRHGQQHISGII